MTQYNVNTEDAKPSFTDLAEIKPKNVLEAAELYTRMGLCVNPCKGKKPTLKGWPQLRLGVEDLPQHFNNGQNVALILGEPSDGLVNIDIDVPETLKIADLFLEDTLCGGRESTPRAHRYYKAHGAKTIKWLDTDGTVLLEQRSTDAQTLVEPSMHPSGEPYAWDRGGVLKPVEASPKELEERCKKLITATVIARHLPPEGGRHEYAMKVIGFLLRRLDEETTCNIVLAAWHAGEGDSEEAVRDLGELVRDTARRLIEGENVFGAPELDKVAPGLPGLIARWWGWDDRERGGNNKKKDEKPTDDELRDQWAERNPGHAYGLGEWRCYECGVFRPVFKDLIKQQIVETLEAAKRDGVKPTSSLLASVLELARVKLAIPDEEWDADTDILVCGNGTLHIPTGELLPHSPKHRATSAVPYNYDKEAAAPTWERFLEDFVDLVSARFLQEYAGYTLTTDVSHEIALWLCGPPGGGRSTFIAGLEAMLGEKAGTLGLGDIKHSRFALFNVPGKTLLTATEQPAEFMKTTHILNALISGDKLKVEKKHKDAFDIYPRVKLLWAMNDVPRVPSANDGLFRRVKVLEIESIPEGKRDPEIKEAIKGEGAGILVWALEGLRRLQARGHFEIPKSVREATAEFKLTNDVPAMFIGEACITTDAEDCKEQAQKLYDAYRYWCRTNGHHPLSSTKVAGEWNRLGFRKTTLQGRAYYRGVKVNEGWIKAQDGYPRS